MAPIKFEDQIKNKLEKRAINPNDSTWDKLADRLDAQERKKPVNPYWWLGVAASIIVIVVVNQFLNNEVTSNMVEPVQIVNEEANQNQNTEPNIDQNNVVIENNKVAENNLSIEKTKQIKSSITKQNAIAEVKTKSVIKKQYVDKKENENDGSGQEWNAEIPLNTIENAVAQINTKNNQVDNSRQVDNEIETLLGEAKASIASKPIESKERTEINPDGLLEEVEFDLDQSFRDKVFQKLKTSYKKVSTAVAHRND